MLFICASLVLLGCSGTLLAQNASGRIFGVITDKTGASLQNAAIRISNTGTAETRTAATDENGAFQFQQLPVGRYEVIAEQPGFRTSKAEPLNLGINQSAKVDITLEVGDVTEVLEVNTSISGVETLVSALGASVTSRPLVELPLNGRNALDLALLQPGVTPTNEGSLYASTTGNANSTGGFSVSGSRNDSITYLLDGGLNNSFLYNDVVYNPNPDTILEFRILTSNFSAEYGRNGGGVVSIVTRSGTNDMHGGMFEFLRNEALNANSYFSNQLGQPRESLKRNQFGFTLGGPVVLPKVYDGRQRLFFFGSYQGQRQAQVQRSGQVQVFTPSELAGDFSRSNATGEGPPASLVDFLQNRPWYQPDPALAAQGVLRRDRIDAVSSRFIGAGLIPSSDTGFLFPRASAVDNRDEGTGKFDWIPNQVHRLSVTLGGSRNPLTLPFDGANVAGFPSVASMQRYFGSVNLTSVLSPAMVNEARVTAQRQNRLRSSPGADLPVPAELGIATTPDNATGPPVLLFSSGMTTGFSGYGPSRVINNTWQFSDTLTWTRGRHTWKGGFSYSPYQNNSVFSFFVNGQYSFTGMNGQAVRTGNDRADFLLGLPDYYYQYSEAPSNIRMGSYSAFLQDEWRVHPRLVLTLGLRYDYDTPRRDSQGRSFSIAYGQQSRRFPLAPPGLLFPGDEGAPDGANFPDRNNFGPRFGLVWDPRGDGRTSLRAGFGVFYDILKGEDLYQYNGVAPFAGSTYITFDNSVAATTTSTPSPFAQPYAVSGVPNPFPSRPPEANLNFYEKFGPFYGYSVDPNLRTPYIYHYNLSLQRQLLAGLVAEASYVGNNSRKLTALVDPNPFVPGTASRRLNLQDPARPDSWALPTQFINGANANYNSLQTSLQKRYASLGSLGSLQAQISWTWAHNIDDASGFEQVSSRVPYYNNRQFRASSDQDIRHYVAISGIWDLALDKVFGRNRLTQGWALMPIFTYRTGQPLDVNAGFSLATDQPGPSGAGDANLVRPNLVNSVLYLDPRTSGGTWFDTSALSTEGLEVLRTPSGTYGSLGRNALRGPARTNLDLRVSKSTRFLRERLKADLILEGFNVLNAAQFRNPDLNFNSGTFGVISTTYDPRILQAAIRLSF
ncbi:MAG: TonB-dependent receptor [Bryobacteraceae bacterium]|nr:TonB-dependent receptor [Bryobacteraceae bacterium]